MTGTIGRKKPIAMQARQVRMRKAAFAATSTPPRLIAARRRLAYQSSAKATIVATIRMNDLVISKPAYRCIANECSTPEGALEARLRG
jgi:hypothetical protein